MERTPLSLRGNAAGAFARGNSSSKFSDRKCSYEGPGAVYTMDKLRQDNPAHSTKDREKERPLKSYILRRTSNFFSNIKRRGSSQLDLSQHIDQERVKDMTSRLEQPHVEQSEAERGVQSRQSSFNITEHQLLRPQGPPLPRSQTCGNLLNPASVSPFGGYRIGAMPGRPDDKYKTIPGQPLASPLGSHPITPSSFLDRSSRSTPSLQTDLQESRGLSTCHNVGVLKKRTDNEFEVTRVRQSKALENPRAGLVKSQSEVFPRSHLPQPVRGEYVSPRAASNSKHACSSDSSSTRRTRRISNIPLAVGRIPSTRTQKTVSTLLQDFEVKEAVANGEEAEMKDKVIQARDRFSGFMTARSTDVQSSDSFLNGGESSETTHQLVSLDEAEDAALSSAAAAAKSRRQGSRGSLSLLSLTSGPAAAPVPGPSTRRRSWIPTPGSMRVPSTGSEAEQMHLRERQYRPSARMSLNYPSNPAIGARTPSYASQGHAVTPETPTRRKNVESPFVQATPNSPTPVGGSGESRKNEWRTYHATVQSSSSRQMWTEEDSILSSHPLPFSRGDAIRSAMPTTWWLGRYTSLVNRLRTEELNKQIGQASGGGLSELGINPEGAEDEQPGMLDQSRRESAAVTELRGLCATPAAVDSLERFLDSKWERDRRGGIGLSRVERERDHVIRRLGVDTSKMGELRARVEAQRTRRQEARGKQQEPRSSGAPRPVDELYATEYGGGTKGKGKGKEVDRGDGQDSCQDGPGEDVARTGLEHARDLIKGGDVRRKVTLFGKLAMGMRKQSS